MWFWLFADDANEAAGGGAGKPGEAERGPARPAAGKVAGGKAAAAVSDKQRSASRAAATEDEEEIVEASAMWVVLPWMTSLLLHVAIIVLGTVLVWSYMVLEEELEAIVPTARLSDQVGGALAESDQMELEAAQDVREVDSEDVDTEDMDEVELNPETDLELVGLDGGSGGARLAPFGTTTGGGGEMGAEFYGAGGNATRIAYLIDASGSMIDTMPFVLEELKRSISELSDQQEFTVVFFHADRAQEVPPAGWKPANDEMKRRVADWVTLEHGNIVPRGSTNPRPALELAMRYRAELIFLLSDNITGTGRYEIDRSELLTMLERANRGGRTTINTIQFLYPDSLETLERIAESHSGVFRFITEADLGLR